VTGLESTTDVIEYRAGSDFKVRALPGLNRFANLVLTRGWTATHELFEWRKAIIGGQIDRRNVSIVLLDEARNEVSRWNVFEAWPCRWRGPAFDAGVSGVAIESIEIRHEGIELG
jgi:phage tail-like protein